VLAAARVAYGLQFQSVGAAGPAMVAELGLDYASLGTLVGAFSTLGIALSLPAGWLIARLGGRPVVLAGVGLMAAGASLLAAAPGYGAESSPAGRSQGPARWRSSSPCPPSSRTAFPAHLAWRRPAAAPAVSRRGDR
jgi:MFS family permease